MAIVIEEYSGRYTDQIARMILDIQRGEFDIPITLDDQPDLLSIETFYQKGNGNFWIATIDDRVVGSVALIDIGEGVCALRKMFVVAEYRGSQYSVAKNLLDTAVAWANARGVRKIYLGTTSAYLAAHRFYEKNEFIEVSRGDLPPSFPVMSVDSKFYVRSLSATIDCTAVCRD